MPSRASRTQPVRHPPGVSAPIEFVSHELWQPERIHALAVYCSDGRWGAAFDEFCQEGLGLPHYDRFAVPGGPLSLTERNAGLLTSPSSAFEGVRFLVEAHDLERIVLITHFGCAAYARLAEGQEPAEYLAMQEEDLRVSANTLREAFAGVRVDSFVAYRPTDRLAFRRVVT